jgi:hypothetical protein
VQTIARLACALYWFHPLAWLAVWRMRVERELACDDWVLRSGESSTRYARWLLDVAASFSSAHRYQAAAAAGVAMACRHVMERRISAILNPARLCSPLSRRVGAALTLLAAALVTTLGTLNRVAPSRHASAKEPAPRSVPDVRVDLRVELLSIVFRLAGSPEYTKGGIASYNAAVDAHFAGVKDHDAVKRARRLRATRGVSFDAVAAFAVHLDGIEKLGELVPLEPLSRGLDSRWTPEDAHAFLADLRDFAARGKARDFFESQKDLYAHAASSLQKVLAEHADLTWLDRFFGARPGARFQVALGLLIGGNNYGPSVLLKDGNETLYSIIGCWQTDAAGKPTFDKTIVGVVIHEICHSYCNPIVDAHLAALEPAGTRIFSQVDSPMRDQHYANARIVLCESLVRASVVRYLAATQGEKAAAAEVAAQKGRSFLWVGELAGRLGEYEKERGKFPTLDAFVPHIVAFFADYAPRLERAMARRPRVVRMTPRNGQEDVDPSTTTLVVTFDRPMADKSWSVVGGGEHFPGTKDAPSYDVTRKVLTIPIRLKADWEYELLLNSGRFRSFRSAEGEVLEPVHVRFRTGAK